ncbi:hypothetical protein SAMN05444920_118128 [Nonomuraea solani]|uniref:PknH-like extracellular domain-containing protein n=1 Tax=Nonomuraea solani TaxID=1144553 RepID=A0A1H6EVR2_9ACTN|nr:hypothetical protein [Nonomuraea solani]SEH00939.1 hypothetical protein SAMN05444920_118128 [Nonomuraea solani]
MLQKIALVGLVGVCLTPALPVQAATKLPENFLLYERTARADMARDDPDDIHDHEESWLYDDRAGQPLRADPCSTVAVGTGRSTGIGLSGREAVRSVTFSIQEYYGTQEQVIVYRSTKIAKKVMSDWKAAATRCARKGGKAEPMGVFRRKLYPSSLGDQAWAVTGYNTDDDEQQDAYVIVRRANAIIYYGGPRQKKPFAKDRRDTEKMLAKICHVASC